jgi:hypothetical protein
LTRNSWGDFSRGEFMREIVLERLDMALSFTHPFE